MATSTHEKCTDVLNFDFNSVNELETKIFEMYKKEITNEKCKLCHEYDKKIKAKKMDRCWPQSVWYVGRNLAKRVNSLRILFVGKVGIDDKDNLEKDDTIRKKGKNEPIYDERWVAPMYFYFPWSKSQYWDTIKYVTYGLNLSLEDIAITNLVKCNLFYEQFETC